MTATTEQPSSPTPTAAWSQTSSHITTTDSNGKPTTIVTTVPSPTGSVDTTVVTNSDGSSETDIISHITTTDSDGKPTTIVTTYPSPSDDGHDRTTVVTNSDGSVVTDIVPHHHHRLQRQAYHHRHHCPKPNRFCGHHRGHQLRRQLRD
ncbi:Hypothetical protein J6897_01248 [Nakaseomyces glabratus]